MTIYTLVLLVFIAPTQWDARLLGGWLQTNGLASCRWLHITVLTVPDVITLTDTNSY